MNSETKQVGKTGEEDLRSVLNIVKEKLRPLLLRKWRRSRASVVAEAMESGMTNEQLEIMLRAFKRGYWTGAVDVSSIGPRDLRRNREPSGPKVH